MKKGKWDIRCPDKLCTMFPRPRRGYWYKVSHTQARAIVKLLAKAYGVSCPDVRNAIDKDCYAYYSSGCLYLRTRQHMKSVFHEFYHHLDYATNGLYNSDDRHGGATSLLWQFADLLWEAFRKKSYS